MWVSAGIAQWRPAAGPSTGAGPTRPEPSVRNALSAVPCNTEEFPIGVAAAHSPPHCHLPSVHVLVVLVVCAAIWQQRESSVEALLCGVLHSRVK